MPAPRKIHLGSASDIATNTTKYFDLDEHPVLVSNVAGVFSAVYGKCAHYNLPLKDAALCEGRIRCPFHHACFNAKNGKQLEAPGLADLASYELVIEDGELYVLLPEQPLTHITAPSTKVAEKEASHNVVIGGGVAAVNAIYGMREHGFSGRITLISTDCKPPYDRTALSKAYLQGDKAEKDLPLLPADWYEQQQVELMLSTRVTKVNTLEKQLYLEGGKTMSFNRLLIATGGKARKLPLEDGGDLENVFYLRDFSDSQALKKAAKKAQRVVIIGAGFIGLEAAMSLGDSATNITVIAPDTTLFEKQWGERVGRYVQSLHEAAGVAFQLGHKVKSLGGEYGKVSKVILENGYEISADVVVIGIGVTPNTDFVVGAPLTEDGGLRADSQLSVALDVYAAGDIVNYPDPRYGRVRIEHWKVAAQQGRIAGANLAGKAINYTMLPFFWSNQQGNNFRYAGHATNWDVIEFDGRPEDGEFLARYLKDGKLQAVLGLGKDQEVAKLAESM